MQNGSCLKVEKPVQEDRLGEAGRPRLPRFELRHGKRILLEGLAQDSKCIAHVLAAPANDVTGFASHSETICRLVPAVGGSVPRRQGIALANKGLQPLLELAKWLAEVGLERTDRVPAEQALGSVVQQFPERLAGRQNLVLLPNLQDEQAVLSDT